MTRSIATVPDRIREIGRRAFGPTWQPSRVATAPGRIELLGNHVDYNGGPVLAGAIDRVIQAWSAPSAQPSTIDLFAPDIVDTVATVTVDGGVPNLETYTGTPAAYLAGIVQALQEATLPIRGSQHIVVTGSVPIGFGMSSSAALCVTLTILACEPPIAPDRIVDIARRAEHITGAPVGAMDQTASVSGGVILFDGASTRATRIDPALDDCVFAVAGSGVHRSLTTSAYPRRVRESEEALAVIRAGTETGAIHLGQLAAGEWERAERALGASMPPNLRNRVRHIVTEVERVRQGVDAIEAQDWPRFGALMTASGRSSASDYDISHPIVEELVGELNSLPGVLGARMMGGGEGGPALALLRRDAVPSVRSHLERSFFARHALDPDAAFEICTFGPGASIADVAE